VVCATQAACDKLLASLKAQIQKLESKGSLTKADKKTRYQLRKQILAVQKAKTAEAKAETAAVKRVLDQLDTIEAALSTGKKTQ